MSHIPEVVEVAVPLAIHQLFSYLVPQDYQAKDIIGKRVHVNFKNKKVTAFVIEQGTFTNRYPIKPILRVIDAEPIFTLEMVNFARWIADYYFASLGETLSMMVPKGIRPKYFPVNPDDQSSAHQLTDEQNQVYQSIYSDINKGKRRFYLYGVTGSGKTEIYFKLIEDTIARGQSVIFLVPEIVLSRQTLNRLKQRFGNQCAWLHSQLSVSHKLGEYLRLLRGEAKIAIGPRSALFAPVSNPGLIIMDEENESAFKSEESPRFHARTAALYLANKKNAIILLGSATPSIESWYYTQKQYFSLYSLPNRYGNVSLPSIQLVDQQTLPGKNLSFQLVEEVNRRILNGEQVILLQNRRGFANFIKCKECDYIFQCPHCSISLTFHKTNNQMICHRCGFTSSLHDSCPECHSKQLMKIGAGTQKIEEEIQKTFSHARILRIDYDSLKENKNIEQIFQQIENREIDILVGTQMIAKGLHFPGIKFVGVINADQMLNLPDFKAAERTFTLITQVAGRAGRVDTPGLVLIQTKNPDHYSISSAVHGRYESFFKEEIQFRKLFAMPPFKRMIRLIVRGPLEDKADEDSKKISNLFNKHLTKEIELLGSSACLIPKINQNYRFQILLKSNKLEWIQQLVKNVLPEIKLNSKNYLEIDVDPIDLF
ncbi:MAG: primosomal protein N' [Spirochaetes bacterium]|nr:primosomal protein N' [Spirochaetota bacterium]